MLGTNLPNLFASSLTSNVTYTLLNRLRNKDINKDGGLPSLITEETWSNNSNKTETSTLFFLHDLVNWGKQLNPSYSRWDMLEGQLWLQSGEFRRAQQVFKSALFVPDNNILATYFYLGLSYELASEHESAIQIWQDIPDVGFYFLLAGKDQLEKGNDLDLALKYLEIATAILPESCEALYYQGIVLNQVNQSNALLYFWPNLDNQTCSNTYYLGELYYERGRLFQSLGYIDEALKDFRIAWSYDSENIKRMVRLANLLAENGSNVEAKSLYEKVIELDPGEMWGYLGFCNLERINSHYLEALQWCQEALSRFPDNNIIHYYIGIVYWDMGEIQEAIFWFERAVNNGELNGLIWMRLGEAYQAVGNYERALLSYQKALEINPHSDYSQQKLNELSD